MTQLTRWFQSLLPNTFQYSYSSVLKITVPKSVRSANRAARVSWRLSLRVRGIIYHKPTEEVGV